MQFIASRLSARGLQSRHFAYSVLLSDKDLVLARLENALRQFPPGAFVAHSTGGLLLMEFLSRHTEYAHLPIVLLGSPLAGSGVASRLARLKCGFAMGWAKDLLTSNVSVPGKDVHMIAGSVPIGPGRILGCGRQSDGTVAIDETRVDALRSHCIMPVSHSGMLVSRSVSDKVYDLLTANDC